ncbi:hypothetical protein AB0M54_38755 [Actinoplanes sp. NPDC051470]|uniref:hypothetical protein n=1 Tax=Actinoplanes sp. NPDC051470 TaxID=3157224 RepID=UPI00341A11FA
MIAAVTLVAVSRTAEALVADPSGGPVVAVVDAVRRRAGCPVLLAREERTWNPRPSP